MSHFKHNPDKRGTLASELGSGPPTEPHQQAPLWASTKRPPRPARGNKRRFGDCHPCYSYSDENDDDDEELIPCKQERFSEITETLQAKFAQSGSSCHPSTHVTNLRPARNTTSFHQSDSHSSKHQAPYDNNMGRPAQKVPFKVCS